MKAPETATQGGATWDAAARPEPGLLAELKAGPFGKDPAGRESLITALRRDDVTKPVIFVGAGTCGLGAGADRTLEAVKAYCAGHKVDADIREVGCIGLCSEEPTLDIQLPGRARLSFGTVTAEKVDGLLERVLAGEINGDNVLGQHRSPTLKAWDRVAYLDQHPFMAIQKRWVLANSGIIDFGSIDEYIARGGYSALYTTLRTKTRQEVVDAVLASGLRGRGGGGFPTGKKWQMALAAQGGQKYLICNADEGDPGAFMDRAVCESDPHRLVEGMVIGAYAIGATKAYVYTRAEYPIAIRNLRAAIEQAKQYGLLGDNILRSGFSLEIIIKMGAGAFVCGEETALIHSIEGRRGMPRPRPPYPVASGVFGKPTVINNVETLANIPTLMAIGAEAFSAVGTAGSKGTKVFALSGMVNRTGLVEIPMGTTIRQVIFAVGGGTPHGRKCKAVQIGGPSGGCIPEPHLDIPCDYEALKEFGAIMGSGGLVVMDESTCMVDLAKFFMEFIQNESCGKCIPCRVGTRRMLEILQAITRPRLKEEDNDALLRFQGIMYMRELGEVIRKTSLCGLGQTAPNPVLSTLRWFRDEYEAHIYERRCPAGSCRELVGAPCQSGCPVGTEVWRYVAHIGRGEYEEAYRTIRAANPFPSACARVCNHPCEDLCRCGTTGGEPIAVRALKRFVVDHIPASAYRYAVKPARPDGPRVAVIGAGPSGLTAAHLLSLQGYRVTVFERECKPGGMLICGIPEYRLPRETLQAEIDTLLNENIELRCGQALGRDFTLGSLKGDGYSAIYVSTGSHRSRRLGVPGEDVEGVIHGIRFLKAFNLEGRELAVGRVGIIGGGNSALDAARVAIRQKDVAEVTVFYRRTREEMPAYEEEIVAALEEGVRLEPLEGPVEVISRNGRLTGVKFIRNQLGARDESGRARPVPIPGSEHVVALDTLIVAISEEPEEAGLEGLTISKSGTLVINEESRSAGSPGIFGGGDVVTGPNTVIDSIAAGKGAALMIDRYLTGRQLKVLTKVKLPSVYIEPVGGDDEESGAAGRVQPPHLAVAQRKGTFREVDLCIDEHGALCEARRCLRCDIEFTEPA
ncbi:MAG: FAD-dependent oxidoreductase [Candidatus Eisenbacteria bacterium]|uniref:FAD-dependent oxidoreductase n=1 Tax=Eiseniibacteriota bacterium TaxID=2212470 RepID=A0A937XAP4_UNCEI|nr:FAD-dependent oxidoreductase [Candidatus Eisenbacteria bacterium]